jgi:FkbM family methyltransferase
MTPEIIIRSFSNDQAVFDNVFFDNYYGIKGDKEHAKIVCDIGSHAGYFAFTALSLGVKKVYCFEPYIDSFSVLLKNCYNHTYLGRVTPYQLGVYPSSIVGKFSPPQLIDGLYFDLANVGLAADNKENHYPCQCVTLDSILKDFCFGESIDILKINIGYAEKEILLGASVALQNNVKSICGEVTCDELEFMEFKKALGLRGFINCVSSPSRTQGRVLFRISQIPLSNNFTE